MTAAALETRRLCKSFGALEVARDIDFALGAGERRALIGPNGAGKTTFVNLISGALRPSSGQVLLNGADVTRLSQAERVKRGLARTFQINQLFRGLTVLENVCMSVSERVGARRHVFKPVGKRTDVIEEAQAIMASLGLEDDATRLVRELPYGRQRLVEIAIALGLKPSVLLLDEPTAGVPEGEGGVLVEVIESLPSDISVLIIEHDMEVVFRFAQRITVLVAGQILCEGTPAEIAANPEVRAVYLGEGGHG
jgi:ABC-type branched-subunit amino acid transport system ATPase component